MNKPALAPRSSWSEARVVRLFSYAVTVSCTTGLLWSLNTAFAPWVGFGVGALGFGIVSVYLLTRDEQEQVIRVERAQNQPQRFQVLPGDGDER